MRRFLPGAPGARAACAAAVAIVVTASLTMGLTMVRAGEVDVPADVPAPTASTPVEVAVSAPPPARVETPASPAASDAVSFDGRPLRKVKTMTMRVTAYSPHAESCGEWADGITASGFSVWTNGGRMVAADTSLLPFGSIVSVPGYHDGEPVQVLDRGGAIKGKRLDVLYPTHNRALQWGVQELEVTVWEYAD